MVTEVELPVMIPVETPAVPATMKLSEAIRLGLMMGHQTFGVYQDQNGDTCTLGAAMVAVGVNSIKELIAQFPVLTRERRMYCCVARAGLNMDVANAVIHLNDRHHWTRQTIADWVETVE